MVDILPPKDELKSFWPKPNFRKLAQSGEVSVRCALVHMIIYDLLGPKPPMADFCDMRYFEWPPFWRAYVLQARKFWEDGEVDAVLMRAAFDGLMDGMAVRRNKRELARCAGGRSTRRTAKGVLPFEGEDAARVRFHEALGWPHNALLKDRDSFGVVELRDRLSRDVFWWPVVWSRGRASLLGDVDRYPTEVAACAVLVDLASEFLALRAGVPVFAVEFSGAQLLSAG